jgi:predicted ABC-class ATPase
MAHLTRVPTGNARGRPGVVQAALTFLSQDAQALKLHIESVEDQQDLRLQVVSAGLVAFVRDGAILPRLAGNSDVPMAGTVVPFRSPDSLRCEFTLPNCGKLSGMGLKAGVSLIVGGGFHGKSTLLQALEVGCYDHIPGDGREFVVSEPTVVKIRAEDGRGIASVDISPFISNLPYGKSTADFSTPDASGSTSQAANIMEALEVGTRCLLIDEDTAATNFMIRSAGG